MLVESPENGGFLLICAIVVSVIVSQVCPTLHLNVWSTTWLLALVTTIARPIQIGIEISAGIMLVLCPAFYCLLDGQDHISKLYESSHLADRVSVLDTFEANDNVIFSNAAGCIHWVMLFISAVSNTDTFAGEMTLIWIVVLMILCAADKKTSTLTKDTTHLFADIHQKLSI